MARIKVSRGLATLLVRDIEAGIRRGGRGRSSGAAD